MSNGKQTPEEAPNEKQRSAPELRCSFCSKRQSEVKKMIKAPNAIICDECVGVCIDILEEDGAKIRAPKPVPEVDVTVLGIKPRFKTFRFQLRESHCFHLCPFAEPFNTIYSDHVRKAALAAGFTVERADEVFGTDPIIEDIWQAINCSAVVIADVTGRNPNVMYEIGMAHTVGKPVIIMTQTMGDVPFDLQHYRCIVYEYTPRGCVSLEEKLTSTLRFLKGKRPTG